MDASESQLLRQGQLLVQSGRWRRRFSRRRSHPRLLCSLRTCASVVIRRSKAFKHHTWNKRAREPQSFVAASLAPCNMDETARGHPRRRTTLSGCAARMVTMEAGSYSITAANHSSRFSSQRGTLNARCTAPSASSPWKQPRRIRPLAVSRDRSRRAVGAQEQAGQTTCPT